MEGRSGVRLKKKQKREKEGEEKRASGIKKEERKKEGRKEGEKEKGEKKIKERRRLVWRGAKERANEAGWRGFAEWPRLLVPS